MAEYKLTVKNKGTFKGDLAVYQKQPDLEEMGAMSLAWFTKGSNPNTEVEFGWNVNYNFVWSEEGDLKPGVIFKATQIVNTDVKANNKIELDKNKYGYLFKNQVTDSIHSGELIIEESGLIPGGEASVGIGMSGFGTFIWEAEPNVDLVIQPKPQYWVTYGIFDQGEILNTQQLVNKSLKIEYPMNKYNATVTLKSDNTWESIIYD
ncbi:protein rhiA [Halocella sp. SP3-1]|uniref:protein rhiA n=1 Tax=Halocella sp. SP3-1 TaxID=2382161 RepID=UPI000F757B68|nr:protein rhiA [Halocella sp. SP3-1]AZO94612.1 protein rhiA [Halocella sp. SP3-1]